MSRLKLSNGKSLRNVGDALFKVGGLALPPGGQFNRTTNEVKSAEDEFIELFNGPVTIDRSDLPMPTEYNGTVVRIHYDRTYPLAGGKKMNLVNVVVPDLDGKSDRMAEVENEKADDTTASEPPRFNLNDYAAEALGMVTILSCGG